MQQEYDLYEKLSRYCAGDTYPFHMPGHKRRLGSFSDPYRFDITEIDGFDNLHHAEGILLKAQQRAAALWKAKETFFLVNGSTCGLLTAVAAAASVTGSGAMIMARNCHKAVYHALEREQMEAFYLWPGPLDQAGEYPYINGRIEPRQVAEAMEEHPEARIVLITSPTYDGVISNVRRIAEAVHERGGILIVDEAHGAHYGLDDCVPESTVTMGADLVIQSVHKTLPALTQTALLQLCSDRISGDILRRYLAVYQTSSPSYILLASIDACVRRMEAQGGVLLQRLQTELERFYAKTAHLKHLRVVPVDDPSKIIIDTGHAGLSGNTICAILRNEFHLEMEMSAAAYVMALCAVGDTEEGFRRLSEALIILDLRIQQGTFKTEAPLDMQLMQKRYLRPEAKLTIHSAWEKKAEERPLEGTVGRISAEFVYLYPPGIPLLVPGEQVDREMTEHLLLLQKSGYTLQGMADLTGKRLRVLV